jgi:hypothetical protein
VPVAALQGGRLPAPGALVRVWSGDDGTDATGPGLRLIPAGAGRDLTGVRGRLSRGAGRGGAGSGGGRGGR